MATLLMNSYNCSDHNNNVGSMNDDRIKSCCVNDDDVDDVDDYIIVEKPTKQFENNINTPTTMCTNHIVRKEKLKHENDNIFTLKPMQHGVDHDQLTHELLTCNGEMQCKPMNDISSDKSERRRYDELGNNGNPTDMCISIGEATITQLIQDETETEVDEAFDNENIEDTTDSILSIKQQSMDDHGDESIATPIAACLVNTTTIATTITDRNCVSPVMDDTDHHLVDDIDQTDTYSTPMTSPIRTKSCSSDSTAIVSWPIQSWNMSNILLGSYNNNNTTTTTSLAPYAGLYNLGNTCYMASALQMLSSLPSFTEAIRNEQPSQFADMKLRIAFIKLMDQLQCPGTAITPEEFKATLDDRTTLFIGYRQQDSHEFLTTLLDLLDEDYKKKEEINEGKIDEAMDIVESNDGIDDNILGQSVEDFDRDTNSKKQKIDTQSMETDDMNCSMQSLQNLNELSFRSCKQSYSELNVDAIGRLIHGESFSNSTLHDISNSDNHDILLRNEQQSDCKLVGGRMNTCDVTLTPYSAKDMDIGITMEATSSARRSTQLDETIQHTTPVQLGTNHEGMEATSDEDQIETTVLSPVDSMFTTEVRVRLTCDSCKYSRSHKEKYLHLSLEIGLNTDEVYSSSSIEDGIRRFFAPCKQELKCEKCFCETATQHTEITKLPSALLLHLKRFIVDYSSDWTSITYRKNQAEVHLNEVLNLDEEDGTLSDFLASDYGDSNPIQPIAFTTTSDHRKSKYVLRSVVNHIGSSANCGHYTADARRDPKPNNGDDEWFRFNDSFVSRLSATEAIEQSKQTAYMCLYELI